MLIDSYRLSDHDRQVWAHHEKIDALVAKRMRDRLARLEADAVSHLTRFIDAGGGGYLGISWGKDSVVTAYMLHLVERTGRSYPAVWVRVSPWEMPECEDVRDAFLERFPLSHYEDMVRPAATNGRDICDIGFRDSAKLYGDRHVSGVRAEESAIRRMVARRWGHATDRTCRPILRWTNEQVFAYMHMRGLPVHPSYAMTQGGLWKRKHLRVALLGGERGTQFGRAEWEEHYYGQELHQIREHGYGGPVPEQVDGAHPLDARARSSDETQGVKR